MYNTYHFFKKKHSGAYWVWKNYVRAGAMHSVDAIRANGSKSLTKTCFLFKLIPFPIPHAINTSEIVNGWGWLSAFICSVSISASSKH